jgi:hypothetical protein
MGRRHWGVANCARSIPFRDLRAERTLCDAADGVLLRPAKDLITLLGRLMPSFGRLIPVAPIWPGKHPGGSESKFSARDHKARFNPTDYSPPPSGGGALRLVSWRGSASRRRIADLCLVRDPALGTRQRAPVIIWMAGAPFAHYRNSLLNTSFQWSYDFWVMAGVITSPINVLSSGTRSGISAGTSARAGM